MAEKAGCSQAPEGAKASANLFTLIENAKSIISSHLIFEVHFFDRVGDAETDKDFEALTPKYTSFVSQKSNHPIQLSFTDLLCPLMGDFFVWPYVVCRTLTFDSLRCTYNTSDTFCEN